MRAPEFWSQRDARWQPLSTALLPLGCLYAAVTDWKRRHARPYRSGAKVVCVGNLTAGGAGKTPVAMEIIRLLKKRGLRAAILTRGYGGKLQGPVVVDPAVHNSRDVGDEALLHALLAPVIVARDRHAGAELAVTMGMQVLVMDDGFQNFTLAKDLSFLVVDAEAGFGNGRAIPAGPLRESLASGLARTDAVVLLGDGRFDLPGFIGPILRGHVVPQPACDVTGRKFLAFAGIGRPEKFFSGLRLMNADIVDAVPFPDHHVFSSRELDVLKEKAAAHGAQLITTEKDFVRIAPDDRGSVLVLPVRVTFDLPSELDALLDRLTTAHEREVA